jgi:uncharacterized protein YecE (DUF72 family)
MPTSGSERTTGASRSLRGGRPGRCGEGPEEERKSLSGIRKGRFRCGTSGFQYDHWRGPFYPERLPRSSWFEHYSDRFDTVEINNTFYGLPSAETFVRWRDGAPPGFLFALKFSRYGTHMKYLKDPEDIVSTFVGPVRELRQALGPVLVQLPPRWGPDPERLRTFLEAVPPDIRWAVEFRDSEWLRDNVFRILRDHGAALCIHDLLEDHPRMITTDWTYLRFHGTERYSGSYPTNVLEGEAGWVAARLLEGLDVFAYFNNDQGGEAPRNALELSQLVAQEGRD